MAVVKIVEILAESDIGWEDATQIAVNEVAKTIKNIESVYIEGFKAIVKDNKIIKYRVDAKVSFIVE